MIKSNLKNLIRDFAESSRFDRTNGKEKEGKEKEESLVFPIFLPIQNRDEKSRILDSGFNRNRDFLKTPQRGVFFCEFSCYIYLMKTMIHAKNIELTPSIEAFVERKMNTIAKLFKSDDELIEARVEIGRPSKHHQKGPVYYAEINLKIGGNLLRATVEHMDLRTAIDFARNEIEVQIKKFKSKRRDTGRKSRRV